MKKRLALVATAIIIFAACSGSGASTTTLPPDLEEGRQVYQASCALCHGGNGQGGSAPALTGVLETFGSCQDQIRWITIGSQRHKDEVGPTYGDTEKPITGIMPSFDATLTADQIARVAAFERYRFGGADPVTANADCGI